MTMPTFEATDKFQLRQFAEDFETFLIFEHAIVENGLVVSLDAPFGSGKTTFLQMWAHDLRTRRLTDLELPVPIIVNAWEDDYCGDPITSMLAALARAIDAIEGKKDSQKKKNFTEGVKDVWWMLVGAGGTYIEHKLGFDPAKVAELADKKKEGRAKAPDFVKLFEDRHTALTKIKTKLAESFGGSKPKAIVMVDELDRCRPDYAIHYLEVIKHIFNISGLAFVLAVDKPQLESSTRALFGETFDFPEYYRKFSHRNVRLPQPQSPSVDALCAAYAARFLQIENSTLRPHSAVSYDRYWQRDATELMLAFKLTPRQIEEAFRIIGYAASCNEKNKGTLVKGYSLTTLFIAALSIKMPKEYTLVGNHEMPFREFLKLIRTIFSKHRNLNWWAALLLYSYVTEEDLESESIGELLYGEGLIGANTQEAIARFFDPHSALWHSAESGKATPYAYRIIERFGKFRE